jgi:hypothetical protein
MAISRVKYQQQFLLCRQKRQHALSMIFVKEQGTFALTMAVAAASCLFHL